MIFYHPLLIMRIAINNEAFTTLDHEFTSITIYKFFIFY